METSSIYLRCPGCADTTLVRHLGTGCTCAACGFDYRTLAADPARFEHYLVERMREGPMGQLGAIALHGFVSGLGAKASAEAIRALAARHAIALPDASGRDPILRGALAFVVLLVLGLVGTIAYVVFAGGS